MPALCLGKQPTNSNLIILVQGATRWVLVAQAGGLMELRAHLYFPAHTISSRKRWSLSPRRLSSGTSIRFTATAVPAPQKNNRSAKAECPTRAVGPQQGNHKHADRHQSRSCLHRRKHAPSGRVALYTLPKPPLPNTLLSAQSPVAVARTSYL